MTTCEVRVCTHTWRATALTPLLLQFMRSMEYAQLSTSASPRWTRYRDTQSRPHRRRKARGETTFRRAIRRTRARTTSRLIISLRALKRQNPEDACRPARQVRVILSAPVAPPPLRFACRKGQDLSTLPSSGLSRLCRRNMVRRPIRPRSLANSLPADGHRRPAYLVVQVDPIWALSRPR